MVCGRFGADRAKKATASRRPFGKVMNGYGQAPFSTGLEVPPGWEAWYGVVNEDQTHYYYGYRLNANGTILPPFGDSGDWETRIANQSVNPRFAAPTVRHQS